MAYIDAQNVKPLLTDGREIAFIDVREHGQYGEGHPFFVVSVPYSRLEILVEVLVPDKAIYVVLMDDSDGIAERAQKRLSAMGYMSIDILKGGAQAWQEAGYTLYQGVNLPSKTLGELVEHKTDTPRITAGQLMAMMTAGEDYILVDGRTPEEFRTMKIADGICCPNAELGHRLPQLLSSESTKIIVNCAGRTRSIIGAQGLINQGFENPVYALENGTQGWELAGYELTRGACDNLPHELSPDTLEASRNRAKSVRKKFEIQEVDLAKLLNWQKQEGRTCYLFDIRTKEEFAKGHLPGSIHAPGGQLVQSTDKRIGARGARIVLIDDTGLRAVNTAIWLQQMAHDVYVLADDVSAIRGLETGSSGASFKAPSLLECAVDTVLAKMKNGALLLDLNPSMDFRKAHIDGARWAIRPRLAEIECDKERQIILTSRDWRVAELAALDLIEMGYGELSYLSGDTDDWAQAGLKVVATPETPRDQECIDYLFFVHDRHTGNLEAARGYLAWEIGLLDQLDEQEKSFFRLDF